MAFRAWVSALALCVAGSTASLAGGPGGGPVNNNTLLNQHHHANTANIHVPGLPPPPATHHVVMQHDNNNNNTPTSGRGHIYAGSNFGQPGQPVHGSLQVNSSPTSSTSVNGTPHTSHHYQTASTTQTPSNNQVVLVQPWKTLGCDWTGHATGGCSAGWRFERKRVLPMG